MTHNNVQKSSTSLIDDLHLTVYLLILLTAFCPYHYINIIYIPALPVIVQSQLQPNCKPNETMDKARITVINNATKSGLTSLDLVVSSVSEECYKV